MPITTRFLLRCETLTCWDGEGLGTGAATGEPQCIQKAELGGTSFPHLEQKGIAASAPMRSWMMLLDMPNVTKD